jgi:hypothetical protein
MPGGAEEERWGLRFGERTGFHDRAEQSNENAPHAIFEAGAQTGSA